MITPIPLDDDGRDPYVAFAPPDPFGCHWCGDPSPGHGTQWHPVAGRHTYTPPDPTQVMHRARMANHIRHSTARRTATETT